MSGKIPGIPLCHKWPSGPQCHHDLGHLSVLAPAAAFGGQPLIRHHFAARGSPFRLGQHAGFFHPAGRPPGCPWPPHHWARTAGPARFRIRNPFTVRAVAGSRPAGYAAGRRGEGWKKRRARRESRNFRNTASDWRSRTCAWSTRTCMSCGPTPVRSGPMTGSPWAPASRGAMPPFCRCGTRPGTRWWRTCGRWTLRRRTCGASCGMPTGWGPHGGGEAGV